MKEGEREIIGLDEVGRGPLAGPVVSAAVRIHSSSYERLAGLGIRDSKKTSEKKREKLYELLLCDPGSEISVGITSNKEIDEMNILEATKLSMRRALEGWDLGNYVLIIDGNFEIGIDHPQRPVVGADNSFLECAAASIVAKVRRDRMMKEHHQNHPHYGFDAHKGYGTKDHKKMIELYGPCPIHRRSFRSIEK